MTETASVRLCLVGLPKTGKTTYVAALWSYVQAVGPPDKYRVTKYPDDATYLNSIAEAWAIGADMPRNSAGAVDRVEFSVGRDGHMTFEFRLPDLPGELFLGAVVRSRLDLDLVEMITGSDVLLVFVNADTATTYTALADHELPGPDPNEVEDEPDLVLEELDSDALNTELLQKLLYLYEDSVLPPIVAIASAWDTVDAMGLTPREWLHVHQPQFAQLLDEVARTHSVEVIGVSAAGADVELHPEILEEKLETRSWALTGEGTRTDITLWLSWFENLVGG